MIAGQSILSTFGSALSVNRRVCTLYVPFDTRYDVSATGSGLTRSIFDPLMKVARLERQSSMKHRARAAMSAIASSVLLAACTAGPADSATAARRESSAMIAVSASSLGTAEDIRRAIDIAAFERVTPAEAAAARRLMAGRRISYSRQLFPLSRYRTFPADVRPLLRRAETEAALCRSSGNEETMNVCNFAHKLHVQLGRLGWCWGGSDFGALMHWVRCETDPYTAPGQLEGSEPPFPEAVGAG